MLMKVLPSIRLWDREMRWKSEIGLKMHVTNGIRCTARRLGAGPSGQPGHARAVHRRVEFGDRGSAMALMSPPGVRTVRTRSIKAPPARCVPCGGSANARRIAIPRTPAAAKYCPITRHSVHPPLRPRAQRVAAERRWRAVRPIAAWHAACKPVSLPFSHPRFRAAPQHRRPGHPG